MRPSEHGRSKLASHDCDLDVVDRGQRIEQAVPLLTTLPPDPQLTGRRAEIECRCLELIDVHRVAQDGEVALLPRQPTCEPLASPRDGQSLTSRSTAGQ